jgi:hypothetical protein
MEEKEGLERGKDRRRWSKEDDVREKEGKREKEDERGQEVWREQGQVRIGGERKERGIERRMYVHI